MSVPVSQSVQLVQGSGQVVSDEAESIGEPENLVVAQATPGEERPGVGQHQGKPLDQQMLHCEVSTKDHGEGVITANDFHIEVIGEKAVAYGGLGSWLILVLLLVISSACGHSLFSIRQSRCIPQSVTELQTIRPGV